MLVDTSNKTEQSYTYMTDCASHQTVDTSNKTEQSYTYMTDCASHQTVEAGSDQDPEHRRSSSVPETTYILNMLHLSSLMF